MPGNIFKNLIPQKSQSPGLALSAVFIFLSISVINAQPPAPQFQPFQPISVQPSQRRQQYVPLNNGNNTILQNNSIDEQNRQYLQKMGMLPGPTGASRQEQLNELHQEENGDAYRGNILRFKYYLEQFSQLNPDNFSITKAVYLGEAAYFVNPPPFGEFENQVKKIAGYVRLMMKQRGLTETDNAAINSCIQKLYSQDNLVYDNRTGKTYKIHFHYDFDDPFGETDWTKMFVLKLLGTGSGQCHSMPLLYLCVAEQLHAKAYLSLAPGHSFIQFFDKTGKLNNFETTCGRLVATEWLMQSDAISVTALKNSTYLDTLSSRKLYAQCLADIQWNYLTTNRRYDGFYRQLAQKILFYDSTNLGALMAEASRTKIEFENMAQLAGNPPKEQWVRYPQLQRANDDMVAADARVKQTGYQPMPEEQYLAWLQSAEKEKLKQQQAAKKTTGGLNKK